MATVSPEPWAQRLEEHAERVDTYMRDQQRRDRPGLWAASELLDELKAIGFRVNRDHLYGALGYLYGAGRLRVEGARLDGSRFGPSPAEPSRSA